MSVNGIMKIRFSANMSEAKLRECFGKEGVMEGLVNLLNLEGELAELIVFDHDFVKIEEEEEFYF